MSERLTDEQLCQIARLFTDQSIEAAAVNEALALRAHVAKLEAALAEAERVRDEWCAEYVKARDALKPFAAKVDAASLSEALGHITREHLLDARSALGGAA